MKCPKCSYTSFDYNQACPKCKIDLSPVREQLHLSSYRPDPPALLGALIGDMASEESGMLLHEPGLLAGQKEAGDEYTGALDFDTDTIELEVDPAFMPQGMLAVGEKAPLPASVEEDQEIVFEPGFLQDEDIDPGKEPLPSETVYSPFEPVIQTADPGEIAFDLELPGTEIEEETQVAGETTGPPSRLDLFGPETSLTDEEEDLFQLDLPEAEAEKPEAITLEETELEGDSPHSPKPPNLFMGDPWPLEVEEREDGQLAHQADAPLEADAFVPEIEGIRLDSDSMWEPEILLDEEPLEAPWDQKEEKGSSPAKPKKQARSPRSTGKRTKPSRIPELDILEMELEAPPPNKKSPE